jgi:uncharacterized OsmC-like protein
VEEGVLVIKRIHVRYTLLIDPAADRAKLARAFDTYMAKCPVYVSIRAAIDVTHELDVREVAG